MSVSHDSVKLSQVSAGHYRAGTFVFPFDSSRVPRYRGHRFSSSVLEAPQLEPIDGWLWYQATGDGVATVFTFGEALPPNVVVDNVQVIILNTSGTAATTVKLGKSGSDAAYMAASSFTSSMATAGAKAPTLLRALETTVQTPIATFSAAWDTGAKALLGVHYTKVPATI